MDRIIRQKHTDNFSIVPNAIFKNGLSLKAIGLLTFILHLPADWRLYKTYLHKNLPKDKRTAIDGAWNELEAAGYITTLVSKSQKNNLPVISYIVHDVPQTSVEKQHEPEPQPVQDAQNQHAQNDHAQNVHVPITNHTKNDLNKGSVNTTVLTAPPKTEGVKKEKKKKEKKPADPVYVGFIEIYDTWFKKNNAGLPPKIDGAGGNAAKSLIGYFRTIVRSRAKLDQVVLEEAGENERVLQSWQLVLDNWGNLEPFYQDKTRLIDINMNIQNILNQVKNGYRKQKQSGSQNGKIDGGALNEMLSGVAGRFGNQTGGGTV